MGPNKPFLGGPTLMVSRMENLLQRSFSRTQDSYLGHYYAPPLVEDPLAHGIHVGAKLESEFGKVRHLAAPVGDKGSAMDIDDITVKPKQQPSILTDRPVIGSKEHSLSSTSGALALTSTTGASDGSRSLALPMHRRTPEWHNPWEVMRVSLTRASEIVKLMECVRHLTDKLQIPSL